MTFYFSSLSSVFILPHRSPSGARSRSGNVWMCRNAVRGRKEEERGGGGDAGSVADLARRRTTTTERSTHRRSHQLANRSTGYAVHNTTTKEKEMCAGERWDAQRGAGRMDSGIETERAREREVRDTKKAKQEKKTIIVNANGSSHTYGACGAVKKGGRRWPERSRCRSGVRR